MVINLFLVCFPGEGDRLLPHSLSAWSEEPYTRLKAHHWASVAADMSLEAFNAESCGTVNMTRVNIAARIWLSIGIFIVGFLISMGLQQVQGIETEKTLRTTSEVLFPSAQMSQGAEAAFHRAIKDFSDAVLTQDWEGLRHAEEEGSTAVVN